MRLSCSIATVLTQVIYATLAIQIGRGLSRPVDSVSSISSLLYRHTGYIDQKVRGNAYTSLNHESYHLRNVAALPAASWNASLGPSNITSDSIAVDEPFILPDTVLSNSSSNASSPSNTARLTDIPLLFQSTEALATTGDADVAWNNQTDAACATALSTLNGVATNPSGMAACYNIRNFDKISGLFLADLRLFRIAAPGANWTRLLVSSETLDVSYASASITRSGSMRERNIVRRSLAHGRIVAKNSYLRRNIMGGWNKTKRASTTVALPPIQEAEAKDMYLRRINGTPPKMLQGFTFTAELGGNISALTMNEYVVNDVVTLSIAIADPFAQDNSVFHPSAQHHLLRRHHGWHCLVYSAFRLRCIFRQWPVYTIQHDEHDIRSL